MFLIMNDKVRTGILEDKALVASPLPHPLGTCLCDWGRCQNRSDCGGRRKGGRLMSGYDRLS